MSNDYEGGNRSEIREASIGSMPGETRKDLIRILTLLGLAIAALLPLSVSANAQSDPGGKESLEQVIIKEMGVESNTSERSFASVKEDGRTQVNVSRTDNEENWAFGTAVIEAPKKRGHYPKGWLFVAESAEEGWDVALEGTSEFSSLAAEAPEEVVSAEEKETFGSSRSLSAARTGTKTRLRLPWRKGASWYFTGGPHGWNTGYDRPYSALDLTGRSSRDQRVRAAGEGRVYTMCGNDRGWIRVYHPNGYTTDYYHLIKNIQPRDGKKVKRGAFLGLTGNDVSCGGASYGRHVHFALLKGNRYVAMHRKIIGGWKFVQGEAYGGYAVHDKLRRSPGNLIRNYGP